MHSGGGARLKPCPTTLIPFFHEFAAEGTEGSLKEASYTHATAFKNSVTRNYEE
ncbi:MAG: hypothetical protein NG784_14960 [Candidatus Jettenia sp.]|nr:hypothetical protein [Candidatus Jettenia sp.]